VASAPPTIGAGTLAFQAILPLRVSTAAMKPEVLPLGTSVPPKSTAPGACRLFALCGPSL
jgi:hypothetical protein